MRLVTFWKGGALHSGVREGGHVRDTGPVARLGTDVRRWTEAGPSAGTELDPATLTHGPSLLVRGKLICIGLNYHRHAVETGAAIPGTPVVFSKFDNAVAAHRQRIGLPESAHDYDYEVELGVVIGRRCRDVRESEALDHVFGYCTTNDLSARDLQMRTSQWLLGKSLDGFLPVGPELVTSDEVGDPQRLGLRTWANGELRQSSTTADMIFSVAEIIAYLSRHMTLEAGDFIATGTPEGVVLGMADKRWLQPGDRVEVEVQGLGRLTNDLVDWTKRSMPSS